MAENGGQFLGLKPTHPGAPFGYPGAEFGNAGTILFLKPSNVEEVVDSTRREVCYAIIRPCFGVPEAAEEAREHAGTILFLKPSNVQEVVASTRREVCYAIIRPCFGVPETAEEAREHGGTILFLKPSISGFVRGLDLQAGGGQILFLKPSVPPSGVTWDSSGKVGRWRVSS